MGVVFRIEIFELSLQVDLRFELARFVECTFDRIGLFRHPLLLFEVPMPVLLIHQADACVPNRLLEEIICADRDGCVIAEQVVLAVRISLHREGRQFVAADTYSSPRLWSVIVVF